MEEKKLTDEEIVKALDFCAKDSSCLWDSKCPLRNDKDCHVTLSGEALDLIKRLQGENERLNDIEFTKEHCDLYKENEWLKTEIKRELAEHEEFTKKAKEEIERLTEELKCEKHNHKATQWHFDNSYKEGVRLLEVNKELQKRVDELKAFKNEAISMSLYWKGRKDGEEVAVKDTAKEICDLILEHWEKKQFVECDWLRVAISEKYGVEVE